MVNSIMKIHEILNEGVTDIVARFYKEASADSDRFFNRDDVKYKDKNKKYYSEHFEEWYKDEIVPVFTKPTTKPQPSYTSKPKDGKLQSAGYRGKQYALAAAGLPYDHTVQKYMPNAPAIMTSELSGAINNNGN